MKNKLYKLFFSIFVITFFSSHSYCQDQFNFDVTEVEILDNGNLFKGLKKGTITTNSGLIINSDKFEYNKIDNILKTKGNTEFNDSVKNIIINADEAIYYKNDEIIITNKNSKAINENGITIEADKFEYNKIDNILKTKGNTEFNDSVKNIIINADEAIYYKNDEIIITNKNSKAINENGITIEADKFEYNKIDNIFYASGNVVLEDPIKNYKFLQIKLLMKKI